MEIDWRGVFPAATTQFAHDQSLDIPATLRHLDVLIGSGVHGLVVLGTVGENGSLEYGEKLDVVEAAVDHVAGRLPMLVGVAENSTAAACRFSAAAQDRGADGLMVLPAIGYKSDPRETVAHFRAVTSAVDLPIMCYNNPVTYGVDLTPAMFEDLADEPLMVAIKESSSDSRRITDLKNRCGDRYALLVGVDDLVLEAVSMGAVGWVAGLVNAFPHENQLLWDLIVAGDYQKARRVYHWYMPLLRLDAHPKLVQYIKLAMAERDFGAETVRAPRLPITGPERAQILLTIREAIATRPTAGETAKPQPL